jgi:hypothetical protein
MDERPIANGGPPAPTRGEPAGSIVGDWRSSSDPIVQQYAQGVNEVDSTGLSSMMGQGNNPVLHQPKAAPYDFVHNDDSGRPDKA